MWKQNSSFERKKRFNLFWENQLWIKDFQERETLSDGGGGSSLAHPCDPSLAIHFTFSFFHKYYTVAHLGGGPTAQIFLNFMQFFAKFGKSICWRPPGGLAPPPMGNPGSVPATELKMETFLKTIVASRWHLVSLSARQLFRYFKQCLAVFLPFLRKISQVVLIFTE